MRGKSGARPGPNARINFNLIRLQNGRRLKAGIGRVYFSGIFV